MIKRSRLKRVIPYILKSPARSIYYFFFWWLQCPPECKPSLWDIILRPLKLPMIRIRLNHAPLWNWIKEHKPERILEIGLGSGANAMKMIELSEGCTYFCFDDCSWEDSREIYEDIKDKDNVSFFTGDTKKTLPKHIDDLPKMDLIFIDGGHDYETVKNDWEYCRRLMHKKTACFFHDYDLPGVKKVVDGIDKKKYSKQIIKPLNIPPYFALVTKRSGG